VADADADASHDPKAEATSNAGEELTDWRVDPLSGVPVVIARSRQDRPNLPLSGCPFCPGGLEAPEPYTVAWFKNRWPPLTDDRCEVVLFSPHHEASLGSLSDAERLEVVRVWTERTEALGSRPDVGYVLIFENRGADVGATIPHPHGQIYAFDEIPPAPLTELEAASCAICEETDGKGPAGPDHSERVVASVGGWSAWARWAPSWPFELLIAPDNHVGDLSGAASWDQGLSSVLGLALSGLDRLFGAPMPYMLWFHQRPSDGGAWPLAHLHLHVAPIWRARGVIRYVASGELGSGVMFNPVDPQEAAQRLRASIAGLRPNPASPRSG
jgi:UDPglucose--hexose-1-phosphate uridylyltransferase